MAARRATLSAQDRYKLRLLANGSRFYLDHTALQSLARRGLVAPTGRTDEAGRREWAITDTGRAAFMKVEGINTSEVR